MCTFGKCLLCFSVCSLAFGTAPSALHLIDCCFNRTNGSITYSLGMCIPSFIENTSSMVQYIVLTSKCILVNIVIVKFILILNVEFKLKNEKPLSKFVCSNPANSLIKMDVKQGIECDSDDEVFFGKLTLKEVKKHILRDIYYKNLSHSVSQRNAYSDIDFKIIETSSEPNIRRDVTETPIEQLKSSSEPQFMSTVKQEDFIPELQHEDSFLKIEDHVTKHNNLDNTLDAVDFILNNAPSYVQKSEELVKVAMKPDVDENYVTCNIEAPKDIILSQSTTREKEVDKNTHENQMQTLVLPTPIKDRPIPRAATSASKKIKHETVSAMNTPRFNKKGTPTFLRTLTLPLSHRKDINSLKTPNRSKAFDHIASPIATYIRNCPQVPLVKDVHPKKPLPSVSSIPKLKKEAPQTKMSNKENVVLPPLAYRSAKKTTVMNANKDNWPQSNWPKKLTSSLKKPVVLKHDHRESTKKPLVSQLDSFADLTLHQADVSVCTQKIAFHQ